MACLSDHTSESNMDLYLAVDKEVKDAENVTLSGKFLSKVYEGNFENTGEWCRDFEDYAKSKGLEIKEMVYVVHDVSCMCREVWEKLCCDC